MNPTGRLTRTLRSLVWRDDGCLLIQRRPLEGLLGGVGVFPGWKVEAGDEAERAAVRETHQEAGLEVRVTRSAGRVDHTYNHFRITLHTSHVDLAGGELRTNVEEPRA